VGIKQHFMALAGVGHQPEGAAGTQLHVGDLHAVVDAAHHHAFFAPVELEGLTQVELQGHECFDVFASAGAPGTDVVGDAGVAAGVATGLDLANRRVPCACLFGAQGIGFECLLQFGKKPLSLLNPALRL
jgi:hypothetical protein